MSDNHDYVARTPGPWNATQFGEVMGPFGASKIARLYGPNMEGNARLIAAAPDLLAALREIYAEVTEDTAGLTRDDYESIVLTIRDVASAAIAKAEGRGS